MSAITTDMICFMEGKRLGRLRKEGVMHKL
jgi:hypothetical protein